MKWCERECSFFGMVSFTRAPLLFDCSDPESEVPFAEALYDNIAFMKSFYDSLSKSGVLVMQLGQSPNVRDPDETQSKHKNRSKVMRLLEDVGFKSIHTYEEVSISWCNKLLLLAGIYPSLLIILALSSPRYCI
jgi:hypothetical protein